MPLGLPPLTFLPLSLFCRTDKAARGIPGVILEQTSPLLLPTSHLCAAHLQLAMLSPSVPQASRLNITD